MTQPQQSQRPMRVDDDFDRLRSVQVFPSLGMMIDTVISTPHRPEPAEACCEYDEPEVGSVEKLYPRGRQAALSELDGVE